MKVKEFRTKKHGVKRCRACGNPLRDGTVVAHVVLGQDVGYTVRHQFIELSCMTEAIGVWAAAQPEPEVDGLTFGEMRQKMIETKSLIFD